MLGKLIYNENDWLVKNNRKAVLMDLKAFCSPESYKAWKNAKVKDVLQELDSGVYEYYDVNSCDHILESQKLVDNDWLDYETAIKVRPFMSIMPDKGEKIYVSYPYGVCDNYKQIFEKLENIDYFINSTEQFCIMLCKIEKRLQPEEGGWRWHKWGPYIGEQESVAEYLYDEPNIDEVYCFSIYRIDKK